jgi:hypothetical protein
VLQLLFVATLFEAAELTMATVPDRFRRGGDPGAHIDDIAGSLEPALERAARHEREGLGEAPYPPHFPKEPGEPTRASPSRRRRPR